MGLTPVDESKVKPIPWHPVISYTNDSIAAYNMEIQNYCDENDIIFIDTLSEFMSLNFLEMLSDGLHPNSEGHRKIFDMLLDSLSFLKVPN